MEDSEKMAVYELILVVSANLVLVLLVMVDWIICLLGRLVATNALVSEAWGACKAKVKLAWDVGFRGVQFQLDS